MTRRSHPRSIGTAKTRRASEADIAQNDELSPRLAQIDADQDKEDF